MHDWIFLYFVLSAIGCLYCFFQVANKITLASLVVSVLMGWFILPVTGIFWIVVQADEITLVEKPKSEDGCCPTKSSES